MTDQISKTSPGGYSGWRIDTDNLGLSTTYPISLKWVDTFDGVKNPSWRQQVAAHQCATTSAQGVKYRAEINNGKVYMLLVRHRDDGSVFKTYEFTMEGCLDLGLSKPTVDSAGLAKAAQLAAAQFYQSARSALSAVAGGQNLGEYRETVKLIQSRGNQIFRTIPRYVDDLIRKGRVVRGPRRSRRKHLDQIVSDTYLEWVFGVKPLASDIGHAIDLIVDSDPVLNRKGVKGQATVDSIDPYLEETVTTLSFLNVRINRKIQYQCTVRYIGEVIIENSSKVARLSEGFGFTLDNFVPTIYELIPFSFVVDYFSNLGQVVNAACFLNRRIAWAQKTTRVHTTDESQSSNAYSSAGSLPFGYYVVQSLQHSPFSSRLTRVDFSRAAVSSIPVPDLAFHLPNRTNHWVNLSALLTSRISVFGRLLTSL